MRSAPTRQRKTRRQPMHVVKGQKEHQSVLTHNETTADTTRLPGAQPYFVTSGLMGYGSQKHLRLRALR